MNQHTPISDSGNVSPALQILVERARKSGKLHLKPVFQVGHEWKDRTGDKWIIAAITKHPDAPVIAQHGCGAVREYGMNGRHGGNETDESSLDLIEPTSQRAATVQWVPFYLVQNGKCMAEVTRNEDGTYTGLVFNLGPNTYGRDFDTFDEAQQWAELSATQSIRDDLRPTQKDVVL